MTPDSNRGKKCRAQAEDRNFGEVIECVLTAGHKHTHYWERIRGQELLSASWYGPDDGLPVVIGAKFSPTKTLQVERGL